MHFNFIQSAHGIIVRSAFGIRSLTLLLLAVLLVSCSTPTRTIYDDGNRGPSIQDVDISEPQRSASNSYVVRSRPLNQLMPEINELVRINPYEDTPIPGQLGLEGIRAARTANNNPLALSIAERTDTSALSQNLYAEFAIEQIQLWQNQKNHKAVLNWVSTTNFRNRAQLFSDQNQYQIDALTAESLEKLDEFWLAAKLRYSLSESAAGNQATRRPASTTYSTSRSSSYLSPKSSGRDVLANPLSSRYQKEQLWQDLLQMQHAELVSHAKSETNAGLRAWLELAATIRNPGLDLAQQAQQVDRWRERWARNAIINTPELPVELHALPELAAQQARKVSVLLPLSGRLANAARAIQDGMIAAQINEGNLIDLQFYDTNSADIATLLRKIQTDNTDLVIGPLQKSKVQELVNTGTRLPVLTLNYLANGSPPPNIVQYGLAAEDEAKQLSELALAADLNRVLVLHTSKDWAVRAADSFVSYWERADREVIRERLSIEKNYNEEIATALDVDQSKTRKQRLQSLMGEQLEFQTRRRQDIDSIVVFANSTQLASIKPLLAYHYAGKVPVLSSSKINSFRSSAELRDVNGVIFSDAPFLLNNDKFSKQAHQHFGNNSQLTRLFAMGMDAAMIGPKIPLLQNVQQGPIKGNTGWLKLNGYRIERSLSNAIVSKGKIVAIDTNKIVQRLSR